MSASYQAVQWNDFKRRYDAALLCGLLLYLCAFGLVSALLHGPDRAFSAPILAMRACGTAAFILLHVVLCIGPLARLDRRFLPLLYNRRHLGVLLFLLGLAHAVVAVGFYHGFGAIDPATSLLTSNTNYRSISAFPFETLGLVALLILFAMAATSHDFWLKNLTPAVWKWLHMGVYLAYGLLVLHVATGALQSERHWALAALTVAGVVVVGSLHLAAARRGGRREAPAADDGWVRVAPLADLRDGRARAIVLPGGDRVAVWRFGDRVSATSGVCAHQGGPLAEGRIVDGCITCPWHGYQYRPEDGCAPPPFTERLATHRVRVSRGDVFVEAAAQPSHAPVRAAVEGDNP